MGTNDRRLRWVGNAKEDLLSFPRPVQSAVGFALRAAQEGQKAPGVEPLKGFTGAGVLEVVESHDTDAYRCVYIVRLKNAVYVLHCFQKKAKKGIATPKREIEMVRRRLAEAEAADAVLTKEKGK